MSTFGGTRLLEKQKLEGCSKQDNKKTPQAPKKMEKRWKRWTTTTLRAILHMVHVSSDKIKTNVQHANLNKMVSQKSLRGCT